ncbi:putative amidoligase enzyme-domain-containing protein [Hypoxylon rubiginosum]|uniref:Amidoligase enzyme-domain-containing protein n=1 Tax=Hypoxylon rubiginosum TaxID=110542 RepID=A0ACC0CJG3_9PEZI|nr:putative amidoligase enzyme-domain-containing protein [Hypoxylon rubiginosum]
MPPYFNAFGEVLTFGVELEFYVPWETHAGTMNKPERFANHPGGPLYISPEELYDFGGEPDNLVFDGLTEAIRPILETIKRGVMADAPDEYAEWSFKEDGTLSSQSSDQIRETRAGYHGWQGVELVSPVLLADRDGFYELLQVIEFLRNNFWIDTSDRAGFHIHVGNGNGTFERFSLRRIGYLLYQADPILAQSHPPHRRNNIWAPSNRFFSRVSFGMKAHHAIAHPPEPIEVNQDPVAQPWWSRWSDPSRRSSEQRAELRERIYPLRPTRLAYPTEPSGYPYYILGTMLRDRDDYGIVHDENSITPISMSDASYELLAAPTRDILAQLLAVGAPGRTYRAAYNFEAYMDEHGHIGTIEFRQPESTIDAAAVVCYVSLALRLCEYAAIADENTLSKISVDLRVAEEAPAFYDLYDFLLDVDLGPEADFLSSISQGDDKDATGRRYLEEIDLVRPRPAPAGPS